MLVVTPQGPTVVDDNLAFEMAITGYVASINGEQGAVDLDLSGIIPPSGTAPGSVYTINGAHAAQWLARDTFLGALFDGRAFFLDAATIDGTADEVQINAAITACNAAGGGTVSVAGFPALHTAAVIVPKAGVTLYTGKQHSTLLGATGVTITASAGFSGSWMVDAGTALDGWAVVGINLVGRGGISTALGGIRVYSGTHNALIRFCTIGGMSDSPIRLEDSSVGCTVDHNVLQYDVTGRTLTAPCGVLHLLGSDHDIGVNEVNGGPSHVGGPSNGFDRVSYPGNFYRCAVYVGCHNADFAGTVAEFGDTGWYIDSTADLNTFTHCRSDYSAGHGVVMLGNHNKLDMQVNGCGFADTFDGLFYDGVMHQAPAYGNVWTYYQFDNGGAPNSCRYGWADYTTGNAGENENLLVSWDILAEDCLYDTVYRASPRTALTRGGSGPAADRPASRFANGEGYFDTDAGVPTLSTGSVWYRLLDGQTVGNLATPKLAEGIGGTMQLQGDTVSGTSTLAGVAWPNATTAGRKIGTGVLAAATCTAAGVTAGYMDIVSVADVSGHYTDPDGATTLTVVVRTIAAASARTVKLVMNWYSAAGVYNHSDAALTATLNGTNSTTATTDHVFRGIAVPAGLRPGPVFRVLAAANGEQHWINCVGIYNDAAGVIGAYVKT